MNRSHKISRPSSDFSIARILAEDGDDVESRESLVVPPQNHSTSEEYLSAVSQRFPPANSRLEFPNERTNGFGPPASSDISSSTSSTNSSLIFPPTRTTESFKFARNQLSWLHCTRYRPPKLPRKSLSGKSGSRRRRPGAHPRIPFTALQIQMLEHQYRSTAYLSRRDVLHLSTTLRLPQSRVKIWFQNRRARDRRETGMVGSNVTIVSEEDVSLAHHTSPVSPPEKSPSTDPS